jgi:hypothetical protein
MPSLAKDSLFGKERMFIEQTVSDGNSVYATVLRGTGGNIDGAVTNVKTQ